METTRTTKINWFIVNIKDRIKKGRIDKERLIAEFCIALSSSERTGKEIIAILEKAGRVSPNVWKKSEIN